METSESPAPATVRDTRLRVLKNTMFLVVAKLLSTPIAIAVNAITARFLGAQDYGYLYLAQTYVTFGFLLVNFGQSGTLPAAVARAHARAPVLLGSGLLWRLCAAGVVYMVLALGCWALGLPGNFQLILGLLVLASTVLAVTNAYQDVVRGFERTDVDAIIAVLAPLIGAIATTIILVLGGRIPALLVSEACVHFLMLLIVWRALRRIGVARPSWDRSTLLTLLSAGWPFLFFDFVMALQPTLDAGFLGKLVPPEVVGWYAVSRKLIGFLIFPVTALMAALYPTLCRLLVENPEAFRRTAGDSLRASALLVVPVALGCALFPDIGVSIFSKTSYAPAADNLRVLSIFLFAVYFTMPFGSALLAAGRQRAWALVQSLCLVVSLVLNPLLIPWFQRRTGNGGFGVCIASVISELIMLGGAIWLTPRGVVDRTVLRSLLLAVLAGAVMAGVARLLSDVHSLIVAPISVAAYLACLFVTGALNKTQIEALWAMVRRRRA